VHELHVRKSPAAGSRSFFKKGCPRRRVDEWFLIEWVMMSVGLDSGNEEARRVAGLRVLDDADKEDSYQFLMTLWDRELRALSGDEDLKARDLIGTVLNSALAAIASLQKTAKPFRVNGDTDLKP
jgi:hypothetical protein